MTIGERIKKVRRFSNLTQQKFADRIGSKRNTVATYEMGRTEPSAAVISLICREFHINEKWLKTGKGEMFEPEPNDTLDAFIRERNLTSSDRILIEKFASLSTKARWAVVSYVISVADALWECSTQNQEADAMLPPVPANQERTDAEAVKQKEPIPVSEDGLEDSEGSLMDFVGNMNLGQQKKFYNQMHKLKEPQKESSTSASRQTVDDKAPKSEPPDQS